MDTHEKKHFSSLFTTRISNRFCLESSSVIIILAYLLFGCLAALVVFFEVGICNKGTESSSYCHVGRLLHAHVTVTRIRRQMRPVSNPLLSMIKPSGKSNKAVHSEKRDGERLSRVILDLRCFLKSFVTGLRRTLTYRVLCVPFLASLVD